MEQTALRLAMCLSPEEDGARAATPAAAALASGCVRLLPLPQSRPDNPGGAHFPLGLAPAGDLTLPEALAWLAASRDAVESALLAHGGILFRGFPTRDAAAFDAFMVRLLHLLPSRVRAAGAEAPRARRRRRWDCHPSRTWAAQRCATS